MTSLAADYLKDRDGDVGAFEYGLIKGLRKGQAFFNALSPKDRDTLRGSLKDPFYSNDDIAIENAIEFLLSQEDSNA